MWWVIMCRLTLPPYVIDHNEYRFLLFSAFQKTRSFSNECVIAKTTLNDLVSSASGGGGEGALYATNKFDLFLSFSLRPQPSNPSSASTLFQLAMLCHVSMFAFVCISCSVSLYSWVDDCNYIVRMKVTFWLFCLLKCMYMCTVGLI